MTEQTVERRVVVGVDGSPAARDAVRFALREAALRDATLEAVMAVELPDYAWIDPYVVREHPEEGFLDQTQDKLGSLLGEIGTGDVPVRRSRQPRSRHRRPWSPNRPAPSCSWSAPAAAAASGEWCWGR